MAGWRRVPGGRVEAGAGWLGAHVPPPCPPEAVVQAGAGALLVVDVDDVVVACGAGACGGRGRCACRQRSETIAVVQGGDHPSALPTSASGPTFAALPTSGADHNEHRMLVRHVHQPAHLQLAQPVLLSLGQALGLRPAAPATDPSPPRQPRHPQQAGAHAPATVQLHVRMQQQQLWWHGGHARALWAGNAERGDQAGTRQVPTSF